jgi:diguanylate cyclase (GGDEF)-like protein
MTAASAVTVALSCVAGLLLLGSAQTSLKLVSAMPYTGLRTRWRLVAIVTVATGSTVALLLALFAWRLPNWLPVLPAAGLLGVAALLVVQTRLTRQSLESVRKVYQMHDVTIYDSLTCAHNRAYLGFRLEEEVARSQRYGAPLSVLAVDIAGFYQFADEYGHHAGEIAITRLADRLADSLRETDVIARYRADTFVILLPDTPVANVSSLLARLKQQLGTLTVLDDASDASRSVSVKINFGTADCDLATIDGHQLLARALKELRSGKREKSERKLPEKPGSTTRDKSSAMAPQLA